MQYRFCVNKPSSAVTGKVMASPVQQIPVSAGFQAVQEKESKSQKTRGESTQKQTDEGAQEIKMVNVVYCSQGDQDTSQPQAQVPQAEISSEPKPQKDIDSGFDPTPQE